MTETWIIMETQHGQDVRVWAGDRYVDAAAYYEKQYSELGKQNLHPCIYKKLPDGTLTTEY